MSANPDSVVNQGEFHSRIPPSEPQPQPVYHNKVGRGGVPESHLEVLEAGSAPQDRSFHPDTTNTFPGRDPDTNLDEMHESGGDILPGATSKDVENDFNRPVQGQTSRELHGTGATKGAREELGLGGKGEKVGVQQKHGRSKYSEHSGIDEQYTGKRQHEFNKDTTGAEEKLPVGAEEVASEFPQGR
ncbi:hypothetical protein F5884DRAFT_809910 [Xylogone sp. PMI_703]|nr:hypothetical protein F5884DRAFT_809910 [Xylogone sp. PMI_703]